jgi:integrase
MSSEPLIREKRLYINRKVLMKGKQRGNLVKRGQSWYISIMVDGQLVRRSFGADREAAEAVLNELRKKRSVARASNEPWMALQELQKSRHVPTFAEMVDEYWARSSPVWRHSTKITYKDILKNHLLPAFGKEKVNRITTAQIARFRAKLADAVSPARANRVLELLRFILNLAVDEDYIAKNPALKLRKLTSPKPEVDPLRMDELIRALESLDPFYRPIFTCLAWTGARPSELMALRWFDVDFIEKAIRINKARVRGVEGPPKSPNSHRTIPMLPPTEMALQYLRKQYRSKDEDYVFQTKAGGPLTKHLDRVWSKALKKAEVRHRPSYQLRHTFASMCLKEGISPGWISTVLGHSSLEMTFSRYARYIPDDFNEQPKKLVQLFTAHNELLLTQANSGVDQNRVITKLITGPDFEGSAKPENPHKHKPFQRSKKRNGADEGKPPVVSGLSVAISWIA